MLVLKQSTHEDCFKYTRIQHDAKGEYICMPLSYDSNISIPNMWFYCYFLRLSVLLLRDFSTSCSCVHFAGCCWRACRFTGSWWWCLIPNFHGHQYFSPLVMACLLSLLHCVQVLTERFVQRTYTRETLIF